MRTVETLDRLLDRVERPYGEIAFAAKIARRTLYSARNGVMPRRMTLIRLARVLGIDTDRLREAIAASK